MTIDRDLIERLIDGDDEAFKQVFNSYVKKVYHFVFGYIREATQAEDITQNLFIKIWEKKAEINPHKSFDGWIYTIAYRLVIDYFRQHKLKYHNNPFADYEDDLIVSSITSDELLNRHQLESLYEQALQTLPPKRKEIFLLSRHEGLTNKKIATHLNLSIKTVENQMTAALSSLREFFTNADIGTTAFFFISFFYQG